MLGLICLMDIHSCFLKERKRDSFCVTYSTDVILCNSRWILETARYSSRHDRLSARPKPDQRFVV